MQGKEGKLYQKMKVKDLFDTKKKMENRMMLDVMQIDSQKWPTLADLNTKINEMSMANATKRKLAMQGAQDTQQEYLIDAG